MVVQAVQACSASWINLQTETVWFIVLKLVTIAMKLMNILTCYISRLDWVDISKLMQKLKPIKFQGQLDSCAL